MVTHSEPSPKFIIQRLIKLLIGLISVAFLYMLIVRLIRHYYKFPVPVFVTRLIDKPWRYKFQDPRLLARWHGLQLGVRVLEIGPGNGIFTFAAAQQVGPSGEIVASDIQPEVLARLEKRIKAEDVHNVVLKQGNALELPFPDTSFDAIFLVTVIGEIPQPEQAMSEFARVLQTGGILAFSEFLPDPDYPLPRTLRRMAHQVGLEEFARHGNYFAYTLAFQKPGHVEV